MANVVNIDSMRAASVMEVPLGCDCNCHATCHVIKYLQSELAAVKQQFASCYGQLQNELATVKQQLVQCREEQAAFYGISVGLPQESSELQTSQPGGEIAVKVEEPSDVDEANDDSVNDSATEKTEKMKKFVCTQCNKQFARKCNLTQHSRLHSGDKPFKCTFCSKSYVSKASLSLHIASHNTEKHFACSFCEMRFSTHYMLTRHQHLHKDTFKCDECGKCFTNNRDLTAHSQNHTGVRLFKCPHCDRSYNREGSLVGHLRMHTGERPFVCNFCSKAFRMSDELRRHIRTHTREKVFKCFLCDKAFIQPQQLRHHIRLHTGVKPYVCRICGAAYRYRSTLNVHMYVHQQEPVTCPKCFRVYSHPRVLKRHSVRCTGPSPPEMSCSQSTDVDNSSADNQSSLTPPGMLWSQRTDGDNSVDNQYSLTPPMVSYSQRTDGKNSNADNQSSLNISTPTPLPDEDKARMEAARNKLIYQCPYCTDRFKCKLNVDRHIRYNHPNSNRFSLNTNTGLQSSPLLP